jgi:hypothetical protein
MMELLERGVSALERLAQDPVIQFETAPPNCPHCGRINPNVRVHEAEATGAMAEILYQFHCTHCNAVFYGIPVHWDCVKTTIEAEQILKERAEIRGFDSNENQGT